MSLFPFIIGGGGLPDGVKSLDAITAAVCDVLGGERSVGLTGLTDGIDTFTSSKPTQEPTPPCPTQDINCTLSNVIDVEVLDGGDFEDISAIPCDLSDLSVTEIFGTPRY